MNLYAIGDIHGCNNALGKLLIKIDEDCDRSEDTTIVFLGDYVDRGPNSAAVIEKLMQLQRDGKYEYVFLRGNHEEMMIEGQTGSINMWVGNGGGQTIDSYCNTAREIDRELMKKHVDWILENTKYSHRIGEYFFVHAGITPNIPLDKQDPDLMVWGRTWNDYNGEYPEDVFVIHGHTPEPLPRKNKNQLNIDTGCVFWGYEDEGFGDLTAVKIGPEREEFKFITARENDE